MCVAPLKRGLNFLLTAPTAYLPHQTKNRFAEDPGRGGLNNSALSGWDHSGHRRSFRTKETSPAETDRTKRNKSRRDRIIEPSATGAPSEPDFGSMGWVSAG